MPGAENLSEDYYLEKIRRAGLYFEDDLCNFKVPVEILKMVPKKTASWYRIIPICLDRDQLVLVTDTEQSLMNAQQIREQLKIPVKLLIAKEDNVKLALSHYYEIQGYHQTSDMGGTQDIDADITPLKKKVNEIIQRAARDKASDIHLLPYLHGVYVHFRINGHLIDVTEEYGFKASEAMNLINIIKSMDNSRKADAARITMPDSGSFDVRHGDIIVDIRMATVPIGNADGLQKLNLRLLPQDHEIVKLDDIGYIKDDLEVIKKTLYKAATGLFVNSGPTGAGKTTSLYAQMYHVEDMAGEPLNIMTIDDPIEIREERFTQVQVRESVKENISLTGAKILKIGLRLDPDMFLYNEIRDEKDAVVAIEASTTGHRVFSTVHASNCIKTITRLLDLNVSKTSLLSELRMIISQRLVGVLCPECSKEHVLTEAEKSILSKEELAILTAPDIKIRERGSLEARKACTNKDCKYGFKGRIAVAEYVVFDMDIRDALLNQTSFRQVEEVLRKHNFKSMWDKGVDMVRRGSTELKEIIRVIGKED
ncbi:MAG: type secretion system protein [Firmicutes bacterium]|nr:type secretion system protein [Bacillota bacterium]